MGLHRHEQRRVRRQHVLDSDDVQVFEGVGGDLRFGRLQSRQRRGDRRHRHHDVELLRVVAHEAVGLFAGQRRVGIDGLKGQLGPVHHVLQPTRGGDRFAQR